MKRDVVSISKYQIFEIGNFQTISVRCLELDLLNYHRPNATVFFLLGVHALADFLFMPYFRRMHFKFNLKKVSYQCSCATCLFQSVNSIINKICKHIQY